MQYDPDTMLWNWVELGVQAPFFLLEIESHTEDCDYVSHKMTSNINVLRDHGRTSDGGRLKRVFLLSPGYVNGTDGFQLDSLESVYSSQNNSMNTLFNLSDGRTFYFSLGEDRLDEAQYTVEIFGGASNKGRR